MKALFADTFYYLALLNPADEAHGRAVTASRRLVGPTVTTAWGLTEVADALADPANKPAFLALMERLRTNPNVTIVPPSHDLFRAGMVL